MPGKLDPAAEAGFEIRVSGRVQGVGFRPFVWRLARQFALSGRVFNTFAGVVILLRATPAQRDAFLAALRAQAPPLARLDAIDILPFPGPLPAGFLIEKSDGGEGATEIAPDFATCPACRAEMADATARRHGYAFTNCTHCGPRLTILLALPYDRARTTMAPFPLCADCAAEYADPADRRFHAEPIACPTCGPRLRLERLASRREVPQEPVAAAMAALKAGEILAIKALGGYQLACDATNAAAVTRLRRAKRRDGKPFALMARDLAVLSAHAAPDATEIDALTSREAPIVLLRARQGHGLAAGIAPGLDSFGFMLPSNPLQIALFCGIDVPLVMTSGNLAGDPQIIADAAMRRDLGEIAGFALTHEREIARRVDDSLARVMGGALRLIRRGRGYAPASLPLPSGFEQAPAILAYGADLKSAFCLLGDGRAVLAAHQGDLENAGTIADFERSLALYRALYAFAPQRLAADAHPGYASTLLARREAEAGGLPLQSVPHHQAHIAAVAGENRVPRGEAVLGIALDGLGLGEDATLWGAEILYGDYAAMRRIGGLLPTPLPGGDAAAREPWRNLFAALERHHGWAAATRLLGGHPLLARLEAKPLALLRRMIAAGLQAPLASSCGRLFDAVACAIGLAFERQSFEGEAAMHLEALCQGSAEGEGYRFGIVSSEGFFALDPAPFWRALLADVAADRPGAVMARDFHAGLMSGFVEIARRFSLTLPRRPRIVLGGGSFQNRVLFEGMVARLEAAGFAVLTPAQVPANDGGIAFGQALVAAARALT